MKTNKSPRKIILYTCNWHAFHSLEDAGKGSYSYSTEFFPLRVSCLGRISPGMIIKTFAKGADGVCLIGCPEGDCHYQNGVQQAQKAVREARKLIELLGLNGRQLQLHPIHADECEILLQELQNFLVDIRETEVAP
jgi:coenzyme F420-reducing hydrogenase delta subunit